MIQFLSYRRIVDTNSWPKLPPDLTDAQRAAREKYMFLWHQELPRKYAVVESFNHGYIANLPRRCGLRTLEIGAGLGTHLGIEGKDAVDGYYCLEYREDFCREIRKILSEDRVVCGDIQSKQP